MENNLGTKDHKNPAGGHFQYLNEDSKILSQSSTGGGPDNLYIEDDANFDQYLRNEEEIIIYDDDQRSLSPNGVGDGRHMQNGTPFVLNTPRYGDTK